MVLLLALVSRVNILTHVLLRRAQEVRDSFERRVKKEEDNNNIINYNNLIRTHARTHTPHDVYIHMKDDDFQKKNLRTPSQRKL